MYSLHTLLRIAGLSCQTMASSSVTGGCQILRTAADLPLSETANCDDKTVDHLRDSAKMRTACFLLV
jgi:hypothetical protein